MLAILGIWLCDSNLPEDIEKCDKEYKGMFTYLAKLGSSPHRFLHVVQCTRVMLQICAIRMATAALEIWRGRGATLWNATDQGLEIGDFHPDDAIWRRRTVVHEILCRVVLVAYWATKMVCIVDLGIEK